LKQLQENVENNHLAQVTIAVYHKERTTENGYPINKKAQLHQKYEMKKNSKGQGKHLNKKWALSGLVLVLKSEIKRVVN
jgi:hypothetical protein